MGRWYRDHLGSDRGAHGSRAAVLHLAPDPSGGLRVTADSGVASLDAILTTVATAVADG